jgi:hypothetical protein
MNSTVPRFASRHIDGLLTLPGFLGLALYDEALPDAAIDLALLRD